MKPTVARGKLYQIWQKDIKLSKLIDKIIKEQGRNHEKEILNKVIHIKRIREIALLMEKESRIRPKKKRTRTRYDRVTSIVQGGLPSLGKRS